MGASTSPISRRTVAKGIAWTAPVVVTAGNAPAIAASPSPVSASGTVCSLFYGGGSQNYQTMNVYLGVTANGVVPAGTVFTWTVTQAGGASGGNNEVPTVNYSQADHWTLTTSPAAGTLASSYTATLTFTSDYEINGTWCAPALEYTDIYTVRPGADLTLSSTVTGDDVQPQLSSLSWSVPKRHSTETSLTVAMRYTAKSGAQACYPRVDYAFKSGVRAAQGTNGSRCGDTFNNSSTIYPDGTCAKVNITSGQAAVPENCTSG